MNCPHCFDTGSRSKSVYGHLDCTCGVADERVQLESWLQDQRRSGELAEVSGVDAWLIYQRGKAVTGTPP